MFNNSPWEKKKTFHHILETDSQALPSPERCTLFILSVVEKKFNMGNGCLKTVGWQMTNSFFRELFKLVTFLPNKHKYPDKLNWTKTEEQRSLYILFILKHIVSMRFAKLGQFSYNTFVQLVGKALFTCVVYTNDRHILIKKIKGIECLATMV